jgi:hypothetical protein
MRDNGQPSRRKIINPITDPTIALIKPIYPHTISC